MTYRFPYEVLLTIRQTISTAIGLYTVDARYLDQLNHICPVCQQPFPMNNGELKKIGGVNVFLPAASEEALIPYVFCKECAKKTDKIHVSQHSRFFDGAITYITQELSKLDAEKVENP